jgi:leucyl-tRNA synthetase/FMN phosphatase YigB (HAD superfamily)
MLINWCPKDKIGLANEEVVDGKCDRCGTPVEKREKEQWMLAITKYADRLDKDLDETDFLEKIKIQQRNWIGKSEGAEIDFPLVLKTHKSRFVIIHGYEGSSTSGFKPWLKKVLESRGYEVEIPELPNSRDPKESEQVEYVLKNCHFDENTVIIGHSLGCVVAQKVIMKLNKPISGLVLIASAIDPDLTNVDRPFDKNFDWNFDYEQIKKLTSGRIGVLSDTKEQFRTEYLRYLARKLGARLMETDAKEEHFNAKEEPAVLESVTPLVKVFTTRPDTLFGVTYIVLSPEHPWIGELLPRVKNRTEVEKYIVDVKKKTEIERTAADKEKTGVELQGIVALNPATEEEIPVWIADYVLADYGTGAVMAVPAHDERDGAFAKKYGLQIKEVLEPVYTQSTEPGKVVENLPFEHRNAIIAIVKHWSEDKYIALKWKKVAWTTFITGGIEGNQTPEEACVAEIVEETGFLHPRWVKDLGMVHGKFYHVPKKVNRFAHSHVLSFKLDDDARKDVDATEQEIHEVHWLTAEELKKLLTADSHLHSLRLLHTTQGAYTGEGILTNSGKFDGSDSENIKKEITESVGGTWVTKFKLRDWIFSRQRYWGEPIPVVHCQKHGVVPLPESELPLKLPKVKNYKPTETGESPLAAISKWVNTKCPKCVEDKKKPHHFIFDFDGVLADSWKATLESRLKMGGIANIEEARLKMISYFDKKPHHTRDTKQTQEQIDNDLTWVKKFGSYMAEAEIQLFSEFVKEVKKYKKAKMAVVSSGSQAYVLPLLKKCGLKFTHILAFEDHHSKEEKIELICKDWKVDVKNIHYFTDTKADVYELEHFLDRTKIIGCAWGFLGIEKLSEVLPDNQILKGFKDIHLYFNTDCKATRETDTMPNWAGSSWYYLRYLDPKNTKAFAEKKKIDYWTPVDWYNGGMEHTTLHLLYSRFWHKFLYDLKLVPTKEPYQKRTSHGLILAAGGEKMSKSKGNVVNPDSIIKTVGADALRLYEMFMGPFDQHIAWDENGIVGTRRFIEKVWRLQDKIGSGEFADSQIQKTIKKVSEDIEAMRFNTAISSMMILVNEMEKTLSISKAHYEILIQLLAPFAPHVAEELWAKIGNKNSIFRSKWPTFDLSKIIESTVKIMIQVNGKVRGELEIAAGAGDEEVKNMALNMDEIKKWTENKDIKKVIVVKGRLINFVV